MFQTRLIAPVLTLLLLSACATSTPSGSTGPSGNNPASSANPAASSNPSSSANPASSANPTASATPDANALILSKISTLTGKKESVARPKDGSLAEARFYEPAGLTGDGNGTLFVAETSGNAIRKITPQGVSTLAGGSKAGFKDGPAAEALFRGPWDLVRDPQGNLYVSDSDNHRIRKVAPDGTVSTIAGSGKNEFTNGPAAQAAFFNPAGLDRDAEGNFYIADKTNNVIRKISASGEVSTYAGNADGKAGFTDGKGTAAAFSRPLDVLVTPKGLYVADDGNHAIRLIAADGTVSTVAGMGPRAQGRKDGPALEATLNSPAALASDKAGNIYFVEFNGNSVRKLSTSGQVSTVISGLIPGNEDGPLATGKVYGPMGIYSDGKVLYVGDRDNHTVRLID